MNIQGYPQEDYAFVCDFDPVTFKWRLRVDGEMVTYRHVPAWHLEGKYNKFINKKHLNDADIEPHTTPSA